MKYYSLITNRDNSFQTQLDQASELLLKKNLYSEFVGTKISSIVLDPNEKATDFLSNGTLNLKGHIVSKKVHDASKGYNLFKVQFVDISNQDLPAYKFMFFNSDLTEMIDYEKSNFKLIKKTPLKEKVLDFNIAPSRESILDVYKNECVSSIFKELIPLNGYVFKPDFQLKELDAFRIGHFDKRFYISERLKENFVKMGITGCEYIEQELFNTPKGK